MGWRRGQAYSDDLRHRVLAAIDDGMPAYQTAKVFEVSVSYIYKALERRRTAGEVSARPQRSQFGRKLAPFQDALRVKLS
ncbi:MAG: IS630 transposase-related protein [Pseudomonadota bacterium]